MPLRKEYTIVTETREGSWWLAVCPELKVSGFGYCESESIGSLATSVQSTVELQLKKEAAREKREHVMRRFKLKKHKKRGRKGWVFVPERVC